MATTSKADKPKAKQKPVKKKPEKGESKQPDKGPKSPVVLDENAARDLRSEASDNDNEDSELPNILIMLLLALATFRCLSSKSSKTASPLAFQEVVALEVACCCKTWM